MQTGGVYQDAVYKNTYTYTDVTFKLEDQGKPQGKDAYVFIGFDVQPGLAHGFPFVSRISA